MSLGSAIKESIVKATWTKAFIGEHHMSITFNLAGAHRTLSRSLLPMPAGPGKSRGATYAGLRWTALGAESSKHDNSLLSTKHGGSDWSKSEKGDSWNWGGDAEGTADEQQQWHPAATTCRCQQVCPETPTPEGKQMIYV